MNDNIDKKQRHRSPAYPAIDLEQAINRTYQLYNYAKQGAVTVSNVLLDWGFKADSSNGMKVVAALGYFGLIDDTGTGERRKIQLTERARRIVLDREDSSERVLAIKEAALAPTIYSDLWGNYGHDAPDAEIRTYLIFDKKFNPSAADGIVKDYKASVAYAGIHDSTRILQLEAPKDLGTGAVGKLPRNKQLPPQQVSDMNQDTFTISEGIAVLQWPARLSADSVQDLEDWLELALRKIKRSVASPTNAASPEGVTDGDAE